MYYRNANCAVVVYDITQVVSIHHIHCLVEIHPFYFQSSLDKAKAWVNELQRQADPNIVIALAGNKCDLESRRAVETKVLNNTSESW